MERDGRRWKEKKGKEKKKKKFFRGVCPRKKLKSQPEFSLAKWLCTGEPQMGYQKAWEGLEHVGPSWDIWEHFGTFWSQPFFSANHNGAAHHEKKWVTQGNSHKGKMESGSDFFCTSFTTAFHSFLLHLFPTLQVLKRPSVFNKTIVCRPTFALVAFIRSRLFPFF